MIYRVEITLNKFHCGMGAECLSYNSIIDTGYSQTFDKMEDVVQHLKFNKSIQKRFGNGSPYSIKNKVQSSEDGINWVSL